MIAGRSAVPGARPVPKEPMQKSPPGAKLGARHQSVPSH
jgi:hypothetical protein